MDGQGRLESYWYSKHWSNWLFIPFSFLIQLIANLKRALYRFNLLKSDQFRVPVVVIGNITVGGTGKTPLIKKLCRIFQAKGFRVGVVSRGYQAGIKNFPHLVESKDTVQDLGDEVFMLYQGLNVPMAIGPERAKAVNLLIQQYDLDLIISDDGLQHYRMGRQYEILLIDASRAFGNGLMIPFGPLREPVSRLNSVDQVVINGSLARNENSIHNQRKNLSYIQVKVTGLVHLKSGNSVSLSNLQENSVTAVAGIGNPHRFFETLAIHCRDFTSIVFADHHKFNLKDFESIDTDIVVMTEKDAVKCTGFCKDNWYYLAIDIDLDDAIISGIENKILH